MARFSVPSPPALYTTSYKDFKGVDYRPEEVSVDRSRFADCRNIVFDKSGFPEKRFGWRKLVHTSDKICGVCIADIDGVRTVFYHAGWCVYIFDGVETTPIKFEGDNQISDGHETRYLFESKSIMFSMNECVYVINEAGYIVIKKDENGDFKAYNAMDEAYVPTTTVGRNCVTYLRKEDGNVIKEVFTEGGKSYEKVNLLTQKRICSFRLDILDEYKDGSKENVRYPSMTLTLNGEVESIEKIEVLDKNVRWVDINDEIHGWIEGPVAEDAMKDKLKNKSVYEWDENDKVIRVFFFVWVETGSQKFYVSPPEMYNDGITDNLRITYVAKISEENKKKDICKFNKFVKFGLNNDDRVFICGNDEYKNYIWYSDFNNPLYFPDLNYITVGADDKGVLGFSKLSGYLAVHKEDSVDDANLYLIRGELTDEDVIFKVTTGMPGIGAVSEKGFAAIEDEPLFLTKNGVFAIQSTYIAQEKCIASRSGFINPELEKYDLSKAVMTRWKNLILISVNDDKGTTFVLNVNAKAYVEDVSSPYYKTYYYEGTVWENVFADEFFLVGDELYFYRNTENGTDICKFNSDIKDMTRFNDEALTEGAKAVDAWFKTKMDDDGSFMVLKTMVKRGCGVMIKPYTRSSAEIYIITDNEEKDIPIKTAEAGMLDFSDIDFSLISFNTRDVATIIPINTKVKKYSTLQFMVRNNELSQGMGVLGIEKRYKVGNFKKY